MRAKCKGCRIETHFAAYPKGSDLHLFCVRCDTDHLPHELLAPDYQARRTDPTTSKNRKHGSSLQFRILRNLATRADATADDIAAAIDAERSVVSRTLLTLIRRGRVLDTGLTRRNQKGNYVKVYKLR